jgi:hypothetical protein
VAAIASHVDHMLTVHDRGQVIQKHSHPSKQERDQDSADRATNYPWSKCIIGPCMEYPWQNLPELSSDQRNYRTNHFTLPETFRVGPRITEMMRHCVDLYKEFQCPQERDEQASRKAPDTQLRLAIYTGERGLISINSWSLQSAVS